MKLILSILLILPSLAVAEATTVFKGRPSIKISEGGFTRTPEKLSKDRAVASECVISQIGDDYYWASRENVRLLKVDAGAFLTFIASNGAGYIRMVKKDLKPAASLLSETESRFDYVEHLLTGLRSVTYYGVERE